MTTDTVKHLTQAELEAGLDHIRQSPKNHGTLELIVRRPKVDGREVLEEGELDLVHGLVGDTWEVRGRPNIEAQLNIMNSRAVALIAQDEERWALAGDQLYVDLDLSEENLPAGTRLAIGSAVIEITAKPHTGCEKFVARSGREAREFVNSPEGKQLHLRGVCARVVQAGMIHPGDKVSKV